MCSLSEGAGIGHSSLGGNGTHNAAVCLIDSWVWIPCPSLHASRKIMQILDRRECEVYAFSLNCVLNIDVSRNVFVCVNRPYYVRVSVRPFVQWRMYTRVLMLLWNDTFSPG